MGNQRPDSTLTPDERPAAGAIPDPTSKRFLPSARAPVLPAGVSPDAEEFAAPWQTGSLGFPRCTN